MAQQEIIEAFGEELSPAELADLLTSQGLPLPVDLATNLMEQGYIIADF